MYYQIELNIKNFASLKVYTRFKDLKNKLLANNSQIKRTLPITDCKLSLVRENEITYNDSIIILDNDKKEMNYYKYNNTAILDVKEDELRFPDLVYISLSMFSNILSRDKKYLLHSSSLVNPQNKGIVLVGNANAGKTSLAYELMSEYNYKLISNDHTIIGLCDNETFILGGTKEIQMRLGAVELYFPNLYNKINIVSSDKWNKKVMVNDYIDNNLILINDDRIRISDIYSINTSGSEECFIRQKDSIDEFLFLYESMSSIIKGSYNYITGFDYPMPSQESDDVLKDLASICKLIVENSSVSDAKGSVKSLAKEINKRYV